MKHYSLYGYLPEKIDEMPDIVVGFIIKQLKTNKKEIAKYQYNRPNLQERAIMALKLL